LSYEVGELLTDAIFSQASATTLQVEVYSSLFTPNGF
jgi:hypothetical protein